MYRDRGVETEIENKRGNTGHLDVELTCIARLQEHYKVWDGYSDRLEGTS